MQARAERDVQELTRRLHERRSEQGLPSHLDLQPDLEGEEELYYRGFHRLLKLDGYSGSASLDPGHVRQWLVDNDFPPGEWDLAWSVFDALLGEWQKVQAELHPPPKG